MEKNNSQHEKEKSVLRRLYADTSMPALLHHKIVLTMKNDGLLSTPRPLLRASLSGISLALLIAIGLTALGFWVGKNQNNAPVASAATPTTKSSKHKYALLVHNDDVPPANPEEQFEAYSTWIKNLAATRFADGEALHGNQSAVLSQKKDKNIEVAHPDLMKDKKAISGYFIFEADNAEEALKIAKTCPHLTYQGTVELRETVQ